MSRWIAFWNILLKDMRTYYLKPPNISWGVIFPLAWTGMFFIKSGSGIESILSLLPGVVTVSILFGTTSMLAVTVTFEKKGRSFDRLLLAPLPLEMLMLAKSSGAILFGIANGFVPVVLALFLTDLADVSWAAFLPAVAMIATSASFTVWALGRAGRACVLFDPTLVISPSLSLAGSEHVSVGEPTLTVFRCPRTHRVRNTPLATRLRPMGCSSRELLTY